jgi:thiosulfate/3-mercaptopyruvate sulfurtransferase
MLFVLFSLGVACAQSNPTPTPAKAEPTPTSESASVAYANPQLLVETDWLAEHVDDVDLRIVDVRPADKYQGGHIPNSVNLPTSDAEGRMYDQEADVKWTVLPADEFEALMGELGISNDTTVVAVGDTNGLWASRLFWTLEYYGHDKAKLLNGGIKKWQEEDRAIVSEVPEVEKATFSAKADASRLATKDEIMAQMDDDNTVILATIPREEFDGDNDKWAERGGHIPGALQIDWTRNLTDEDAPVIKSADELAALYEEVGITKDKNVVVY